MEFVNYLLPRFDGFLPAFLATGLPAAFLIADALVKRFLLKQTDFYFFGGDMVFCGTVLFTLTLLREVSVNHITGSRAAVYFVLDLVFFLLWLLVARMGKNRVKWLSVLAALMGLAIFSCCSAFTWSMITPTKAEDDRRTDTGDAR
jgi:hypothetical protein